MVISCTDSKKKGIFNHVCINIQWISMEVHSSTGPQIARGAYFSYMLLYVPCLFLYGIYILVTWTDNKSSFSYGCQLVLTSRKKIKQSKRWYFVNGERKKYPSGKVPLSRNLSERVDHVDIWASSTLYKRSRKFKISVFNWWLLKQQGK
jgi:hypothetical protein